MKILKQFSILLAFMVAGLLLEQWIPLPIPGVIYSLFLLLLFLIQKWIKVSDIEELSSFLVEHLSLMFIPPLVSIFQTWSQIETIILPLLITIIGSTILVLIISGIVTQKVIDQHE